MIKTDAELGAAFRALVKTIGFYDKPANWPLSDEERIRFVRHIIAEAEAIADSEPFLRGEMTAAVKAYVGETRTGKTQPKTKIPL